MFFGSVESQYLVGGKRQRYRRLAVRLLAKLSAVLLIFNSCGVGMGCKPLIFQESRVGFRKNVVPRRGVLWLIILAYDEIMC
jgi:hypothetical protein